MHTPTKLRKFVSRAGLLSLALCSVLAVSSPMSMAAEKNSRKAVASQQAISPVNINRASIKELMHLKGIGEKKAIAIVQYRDKQGKFKKPNDLAKVKGIGQSIVEKNKALIKL